MEIATLQYENKSFNLTKHAHILPAVGTGSSSKHAKSDFLSLEPIVGATFRHALEQQPKWADRIADENQLIEKVLSGVSTECATDFKSVLRDSYFDSGSGSLRRFCTQSLLCLTHSPNSTKKNFKSLDAMGVFFSEVFIGDNERKILESVGQGELHMLDREMRLAFEVDPRPHPSSSVPVKRYFEANLISSFRTDIESLSRNSATLLAHVDDLIRLYLFNYITEVSRYLTTSMRSLPREIEEGDLRGMYYLLEGERASSSRMAVTNGWGSIKDVFSDAFSHINCLEVLNHIQVKDKEALDYVDIASDNSPAMLTAVKKVARDFAATAENWSGSFSHREELLSGIENAKTSAEAVVELWKWIDFQIKNTGRDRIWKGFGKWFETFAHGSLLQNRRRAGYLAVLPMRNLYLLVFLAVKASGEKRIRLKEFWAALELRGVLFDETTRRVAVQGLESIGVLETRSDSGDAQYVRSPF